MATITETLLAKADEFQKKADALRFAAETLNGHGSASVAKRMPATLSAAIALRQQSAGKAAAHLSPSEQKRVAARDEKARIVARILKEHGPLTARQLTERVRKQVKVGPTGLTGIYAYVQRGYITQHKTKNGTTRDGMTYRFRAMPPEAQA